MRRLLTLTVSIIAALALAGESAAHDWTGVARCESGGRWNLYTGNGYEGGLQFAHSTWLAYGGRRYAYHAHQASKWQQILIAERVLRGQGIGAWPVCGRYLR